MLTFIKNRFFLCILILVITIYFLIFGINVNYALNEYTSVLNISFLLTTSVSIFFSVVQIILSLNKDKAFGLSRKELRDILFDWRIKFIDFAFALLATICLSILSLVFENLFSFIFITISFIIFLIYVLSKEVILFSGKEEKVFKTIISRYIKIENDELNKLTDKKNILNKGLLNIALNFGLIKIINEFFKAGKINKENEKICFNIVSLLKNYFLNLCNNFDNIEKKSDYSEFINELSAEVNKLHKDLDKLFFDEETSRKFADLELYRFANLYVLLFKVEQIYNIKDCNNDFLVKETIVASIEALDKIWENQEKNKKQLNDNVNTFYKFVSIESLFYENENFFIEITKLAEAKDELFVQNSYMGYLLFVYLLLFWFYKYGCGSKEFKEKVRSEIIKIENNNESNDVFDGLDFKSIVQEKYWFNGNEKLIIDEMIVVLKLIGFDINGFEVIYEKIQIFHSPFYSNNESFNSNFIIGNFILLIAHLGINLKEVITNSQINELKKFSINLKEIRLSNVLELIDLNYRDLGHGIDLFNFYDVSCNIYWEDNIEKVVNDRNIIVSEIKSN